MEKSKNESQIDWKLDLVKKINEKQNNTEDDSSSLKYKKVIGNNYRIEILIFNLLFGLNLDYLSKHDNSNRELMTTMPYKE